MPTYSFKTYRRTKPEGTAGAFLQMIEIEAAHLGEAQAIAERDHLREFDFRRDFAVLEDDNSRPFVIIWLSNPRA